MTTKQEMTGHRDLTFSRWVRSNLPDSNTGYMVSDLDFILYNYNTNNLMLIEVKTHAKNIKKWQRKLFQKLHKAIKKSGLFNYYGFHCIRFENTCFTDGRCMFDKEEVTEKELIKKLSMDI